MLQDGGVVKLTGAITEHNGTPTMVNPEVEKTSDLPIDHHSSLFQNNDSSESFGLPVYRESRGITSRWFYHTVQRCLGDKAHERLDDQIPEAVRTKYSLPSLATALVWVHTPRNEKDES